MRQVVQSEDEASGRHWARPYVKPMKEVEKRVGELAAVAMRLVRRRARLVAKGLGFV